MSGIAVHVTASFVFELAYKGESVRAGKRGYTHLDTSPLVREQVRRRN